MYIEGLCALVGSLVGGGLAWLLCDIKNRKVLDEECRKRALAEEKNFRIPKLETALNDTTKQLSESQEKSASLEEIVAELTGNISERDKALFEKAGQIAEKTVELSTTKAKLAAAQMKMEEVQVKLEEVQLEAKASIAEQKRKGFEAIDKIHAAHLKIAGEFGSMLAEAKVQICAEGVGEFPHDETCTADMPDDVVEETKPLIIPDKNNKIKSGVVFEDETSTVEDAKEDQSIEPVINSEADFEDYEDLESDDEPETPEEVLAAESESIEQDVDINLSDIDEPDDEIEESLSPPHLKLILNHDDDDDEEDEEEEEDDDMEDPLAGIDVDNLMAEIEEEFEVSQPPRPKSDNDLVETDEKETPDSDSDMPAVEVKDEDNEDESADVKDQSEPPIKIMEIDASETDDSKKKLHMDSEPAVEAGVKEE